MIVTGMYEDDMVFEDGAWKIKRADIDHLIYAPYATGWTKVADSAGARSAPPLGAVANEPFDAMNTGDINPGVPASAAHVVPLREPRQRACAAVPDAEVRAAEP
jgi:hypothetical protein